MIDLTCSFLVVTSGKPSPRSNRIWWPNTDSVPVPVRSRFSMPSARMRSIRSWYWRIALVPRRVRLGLRQCSAGPPPLEFAIHKYGVGGARAPPTTGSPPVPPAAARSVGRLSRPDDRRPAGDLALDQSEQRRLAALRLLRQDAAEFQQALARVLVIERLVEGVAELVEDRFRGGRRREQRVPGLRLELREASLPRGWNVGQRRAALARTDGIGVDLSGVNLLDQVDDLVAHIIDLAADQGSERWTRSVEGNRGRFHLQDVVQQQASGERHRADAGMRHVELVDVRLNIAHEFLEVLGREILLGDDQDRRAGLHGGGRKVDVRPIGEVRI